MKEIIIGVDEKPFKEKKSVVKILLIIVLSIVVITFLFFGITYNYNNRNVKFTFDGHSSGVSQMLFTQDSKYLVSAGYSWEPIRNQPEIKIWDLENGKNLSTISLKEKYIDEIALSPDNNLLACAAKNESGLNTRNIHLYQRSSGRIVGSFSILAHNIFKLLFSQSGKYLALLSKSTAHVYETTALHELNRIRVPVNADSDIQLEDIAFNVHEQLLAAGSSSDSIFIWNVSTGETLHAIRALKPPEELGMAHFVLHMGTSSLKLSRDASVLVNDRSDGMRMYDVASGKKLFSIGRRDYTVDKTDISSDNNCVLTIPSAISFQVWDVGMKRFRINEKRKNIYDGAFSVDGKYILIVESRGVEMIDAVNGMKKKNITHREELFRLGNHALSAALSDDNRFIATGGAKIKIWEVDS